MRKSKHFQLPRADSNMTIEQAIEQLDLATSFFALHPDIENATEVSCAARRYVLAMESMNGSEKLDLIIIQRFFKDIGAVHGQFKRMRDQYQYKLNDGRKRSLENIQQLQKNYSTLEYYSTLLSDQSLRIARLIFPRDYP